MRGLEFNPNAPHLLASGGDEGELCIWDVTSPAGPTQYPAVKVRGVPHLMVPSLYMCRANPGRFRPRPCSWYTCLASPTC